jgi:hypothetical protein
MRFVDLGSVKMIRGLIVSVESQVDYEESYWYTHFELGTATGFRYVL